MKLEAEKSSSSAELAWRIPLWALAFRSVSYSNEPSEYQNPIQKFFLYSAENITFIYISWNSNFQIKLLVKKKLLFESEIIIV